uniref:Uncharacterized protein n=1 Tax=Caenorhabditis tropicalis TaxID=1561998 RepID=A0A1I7UVE1_9PELO
MLPYRIPPLFNPNAFINMNAENNDLLRAAANMQGNNIDLLNLGILPPAPIVAPVVQYQCASPVRINRLNRFSVN